MVIRQRNTREENAAIKGGEMTEDWEDNDAMRWQKDTDARWTKKHGKSYFGYKNDINVDNEHKLIGNFTVTDAATHDSQLLAEVLDEANTGASVGRQCLSGGNRTAAWGGWLKREIDYKGQRGKPLSAHKKRLNRLRSTCPLVGEHDHASRRLEVAGCLASRSLSRWTMA